MKNAISEFIKNKHIASNPATTNKKGYHTWIVAFLKLIGRSNRPIGIDIVERIIAGYKM